MQKRYVVVGSGTLGREISRLLAQHQVTVLSRARGVDITKQKELLGAVPKFALIANAHGFEYHAGVTAVFNCAAYTAVDQAESDPSDAMATNAVGAENAAILAKWLGARLVHISTDAVFAETMVDGRVVNEFDSPGWPASRYGQSKLVGETLVRGVLPEAHVVRVANLYGDAGKNWMSQLRRRLLAGERLTADIGRHLSPTWARWAAEAVLALTERPSGTYHVCARGLCHAADFADRMAEALSVAASIERRRVDRASSLPAVGALETQLLPLRGVDVPTWEDLLLRYVTEEQTPCTAS